MGCVKGFSRRTDSLGVGDGRAAAHNEDGSKDEAAEETGDEADGGLSGFAPADGSSLEAGGVYYADGLSGQRMAYRRSASGDEQVLIPEVGGQFGPDLLRDVWV